MCALLLRGAKGGRCRPVSASGAIVRELQSPPPRVPQAMSPFLHAVRSGRQAQRHRRRRVFLYLGRQLHLEAGWDATAAVQWCDLYWALSDLGHIVHVATAKEAMDDFIGSLQYVVIHDTL